MATIKEIGRGIAHTANKAIQKTGELVDTATKHVNVKTLSAKLDRKYEELGRLTYKQLKTGVSYAEEITELVSAIDAKREELKALKQKIEEEKKARKEKKDENLEDLDVEI